MFCPIASFRKRVDPLSLLRVPDLPVRSAAGGAWGMEDRSRPSTCTLVRGSVSRGSAQSGGQQCCRAELMTEDEARATAAEVLLNQGREAASRHGGAYVFAYHPFPGSERARELKDSLVTVTPMDRLYARVQVAGAMVQARARVHREKNR